MTEESLETSQQRYNDNQESLLRFELFCITRLEADKALLALSSAGVGLIVTLLTGDNLSSIYELLLFIFGAIAFGVCIFCVIKILHDNAQYIADPESDEVNLILLDKIVKISFAMGILLTSIAALLVSVNNLTSNLNRGESYVEEREQSIGKAEHQRQNSYKRQLGGSSRTTKTYQAFDKTNTKQPVNKEIKETHVREDNDIQLVSLSNRKNEKASWEGANNILDTPSQSQESNDASSLGSDSKED